MIFRSNRFLRHSARRLEHLASLRIPVAGMSILEVGAGIGDHSQYYIDRGCRITITEARPENLKHLRTRYPACAVRFLDLENPSNVEGAPFDLVHCYGVLYHVSNPDRTLEFLARNARKMLFLETCVTFGEGAEVNVTEETPLHPASAFSGTGCRPTRTWVYNKLREVFRYVYLPKTQPCHEEFPLDWTDPDKHAAALGLHKFDTSTKTRAIFIGSHEQLDNDLLTPTLIMKQTRHE